MNPVDQTILANDPTRLGNCVAASHRPDPDSALLDCHATGLLSTDEGAPSVGSVPKHRGTLRAGIPRRLLSDHLDGLEQRFFGLALCLCHCIHPSVPATPTAAAHRDRRGDLRRMQVIP